MRLEVKQLTDGGHESEGEQEGRGVGPRVGPVIRCVVVVVLAVLDDESLEVVQVSGHLEKGFKRQAAI